MPKRPNRNKRIDALHVRLYDWLLNSPAYLSLRCPGHRKEGNGELGKGFGAKAITYWTAAEDCGFY